MRQTFNLPDAGEGLTEAEILSWHVSVGDEVTVNQVIVEIETAKAAVELPSPYAGTVAELLVGPGDTVAVGAPIIVISSGVAEDEGSGGGAAGSGGGAAGSGGGAAGSRGAGGTGSGGVGGTGSGANGAPAGDVGGAKIGEVTADGRIATLVGYVAAPGSATRRARKTAPVSRAASPPASAPASAPLPEPPQHHDRQEWNPDSAQGGQGSTSGDHGGGVGAATPGATADPAVERSAGRAEVERSAGWAGGPVPLAKPPVRKLAKELGVDLRELTGSGPLGDITRDDVRAWAEPQAGNGHGGARGVTSAGVATTDAATAATSAATAATTASTTAAAASAAAASATSVTAATSGGVRREPIRSLRRATAAAVVSSAFTAPHVTEFLTVDVTPMIELRDRLRAHRDWAGVKLSPLTFAAKAVCLAARRTPEVNAHWDEAAQEIVYFDRVQLGIAAATPRGLMVPKIRDADLLSLRELATALTELTEKARGGTTTPKELVGGTITITNVGVFGVDTGTPILNPGESAILALGAVKQAPWVVDGELAVRTVCHLALSFDHRLVDGEQGSRFLADVGALLSDPALAMTF
ncbi:MAG TPA: dihydrolipoamide acetyltransferase family protein [Pseudonocardia sp.]|nr:dihydrolipoamide acetyltransferase family protein [Pseudonocardia sp.]